MLSDDLHMLRVHEQSARRNAGRPYGTADGLPAHADGLHHALPKVTIIENHDGLIMMVTMGITLRDDRVLWLTDPIGGDFPENALEVVDAYLRDIIWTEILYRESDGEGIMAAHAIAHHD